MFDSKKLDSYFDEHNTFVAPRHKKSAFTFSWNRFIRLGFPCIAAALLGLMVVLPNIKKSVDIENNITLPRKSEMEKLHVEQVVGSFSVSTASVIICHYLLRLRSYPFGLYMCQSWESPPIRGYPESLSFHRHT